MDSTIGFLKTLGVKTYMQGSHTDMNHNSQVVGLAGAWVASQGACDSLILKRHGP